MPLLTGKRRIQQLNCGSTYNLSTIHKETLTNIVVVKLYFLSNSLSLKPYKVEYKVLHATIYIMICIMTLVKVVDTRQG